MKKIEPIEINVLNAVPFLSKEVIDSKKLRVTNTPLGKCYIFEDIDYENKKLDISPIYIKHIEKGDYYTAGYSDNTNTVRMEFKVSGSKIKELLSFEYTTVLDSYYCDMDNQVLDIDGEIYREGRYNKNEITKIITNKIKDWNISKNRGEEPCFIDLDMADFYEILNNAGYNRNYFYQMILNEGYDIFDYVEVSNKGEWLSTTNSIILRQIELVELLLGKAFNDSIVTQTNEENITEKSNIGCCGANIETNTSNTESKDDCIGEAQTHINEMVAKINKVKEETKKIENECNNIINRERKEISTLMDKEKISEEKIEESKTTIKRYIKETKELRDFFLKTFTLGNIIIQTKRGLLIGMPHYTDVRIIDTFKEDTIADFDTLDGVWVLDYNSTNLFKLSNYYENLIDFETGLVTKDPSDAIEKFYLYKRNEIELLRSNIELQANEENLIWYLKNGTIYVKRDFLKEQVKYVKGKDGKVSKEKYVAIPNEMKTNVYDDLNQIIASNLKIIKEIETKKKQHYINIEKAEDKLYCATEKIEEMERGIRETRRGYFNQFIRGSI